MKSRSNMGRFLLGGLLALLLAAGQWMPAYATEQIDVTRDCSLTLTCVYEELPLAEMGLSVYRVAGVDSFGTFTLEENFLPSGENVNGITEASQWNEIARRFSSWAGEQKLPPDHAATTDAQGAARLEPLAPGLYLVDGGTVTKDSGTYTCAPFLISVPNLEPDQGWNYAVTAKPKIGFTPAPPSPSGDPEPSVSPGVSPTVSPSVSPKPGEDRLPQTGQCNWPIPVLAVLGMILVTAGVCVSRRNRHA